MKFSIAKNELLKVLNIISKGMSSRSTLPILSGISVEVTQGQGVFQTTDLEVSIKHIAEVNSLEDGKAVIPGKLLIEIVKTLPDAAVLIEGDLTKIQISCLDSSFTLSSLNPVDFPYFPEVSSSLQVTLPTAELATVVKKVGKAVSRDESRAILTGILFNVKDDSVHLVATDSYRLAVADIKVEGQTYDPFQAVIPGKTFEDVSRLSVDEPEVIIGFSNNQIVFTFGNTVFVSRKIEGTYPNYNQLISNEKNTTIQVDVSIFTAAIKRVALLAQMHTPVRFSFSTADQKVVISAKTQDVGEAVETIDAQVEGDDVEIAFNHQYILDGLSTLNDKVNIELQTSLKPGIFKPATDESFLYLAMPVRLG